MAVNPKDKSKMVVVEGSYATAHAAKVSRPQVISAYPITPQTHIVEDLSKMMADAEIPGCEYINVESEFSAISALIGASATGARTYSATTSQGLLLMHEALFNASGMRLPIVMTVVNRAVGAPINIWNDQQDSLSQRDCGWIQIYTEDTQEAADTVLQAFKIAEDKNVLLPIMVCMDGFQLSHVYEPVVLMDQGEADKFLPPFKPDNYLDPKNPKSFGTLADPSFYTEFRYSQEEAMKRALPIIEQAAKDFQKVTGRYHGGLIDEYQMEDAEIVLVSFGSVLGTMKDVVDAYRARGEKVGILKIRAFRPFPTEVINKALGKAKAIAVIEKDISLGRNEGILFTEIKAGMYNTPTRIPMIGYMVGHGGRDIKPSHIEEIIEETKTVAKTGKITIESRFNDVKEDLL
ncbi:NADH-dependent phenylglyoxylate dehydrogenase subunit alpha [Methanosarcinaceae archaeon Ag5]|uniref:Pyruvate synthase subunit PorA n=1 Tax=Methanolapillus africanus TaxID=3028297 RepID=A0AAE4SEN5_9EURY|nr:NADH-dependent phenylglyoxylate dehydrogenase subunit alpha [Methanosarcinaceae archaeon Ag5]